MGIDRGCHSAIVKGEPTMREKKKDDRSSAETPEASHSSSMRGEEDYGDGGGQTELRSLIARRAYEIYEERGRQDGSDVLDWLRAEIEVKSLIVEAKLRPRTSRVRA
jgi:DNA relaxase NicK